MAGKPEDDTVQFDLCSLLADSEADKDYEDNTLTEWDQQSDRENHKPNMLKANQDQVLTKLQVRSEWVNVALGWNNVRNIIY